MQEVEQIAQASDAWAAWNDHAGLTDRERLWCKVCRDEGREWLTPEPCEHVLQAKAEITISHQTAMNTLRKLMDEVREPETQPYQPPATNQKPEPSGSRRPLYNEDTY